MGMYSNNEKIEWTLIFVAEFGKKFGLTLKQAFNYLTRYKGIDFIDKHYDYVHTQSLADENGDLTTLLRCNYELRDWQTRHGRNHAYFKFYCVLKTYLDRVEDGPVVYGYCIIE